MRRFGALFAAVTWLWLASIQAAAGPMESAAKPRQPHESHASAVVATPRVDRLDAWRRETPSWMMSLCVVLVGAFIARRRARVLRGHE